MTKYFSKKVKTTPNIGLSSDRHLYLNLEQAEPNLGYPGEKTISPSGTYYKLVTIDISSNLDDRYWIVDTGISTVNGISVFENNNLVGSANSTTTINFAGNIISASASGNISTVTCSVNVSGNYGEVVFIGSADFQTSSKLSVDPSVGILTSSNGIDVKYSFHSDINGVGIGLDYPTEKLHVDGNALFTDTTESQYLIFDTAGISSITTTDIIDYNTSNGSLGQRLENIGFGVSWKSFDLSGTWGGETGIRTDNVTYTNTTGKLLYVSATPGIDRIARGLTPIQVAGSYSIAEVDGIEVARTRDNGTANTEFLFMNVDFFVPNGSSYNVKVYNTIGNQWISSITTYSWSEFEFG